MVGYNYKLMDWLGWDRSLDGVRYGLRTTEHLWEAPTLQNGLILGKVSNGP